MPIKINFTQAEIKKIPYAIGKQVYYQDKQLPNLILLVGARTKTFFFYRRQNGKLIQIPLKNMTLHAARQKVNELLGKDKIEAVSEKPPTLGELYAYYKSVRGDFQYMRSAFAIQWETLLNLPLPQISKEMVKAILDREQKDLKPTTLNNILRYFNAVVNLAIRDNRYSGRNPADGISLQPYNPRRNIIAPETVQAFIREAEKLSQESRYSDPCDAILLMFYTGQRKMNVLSIEKKELFLSESRWTIPAEKFKGKRQQDVYLCEQAKAILERRLETVKSNFLFPSSSRTGHLLDVRKTLDKLLQAVSLKDIHLHDLRRTHGSMLLNAGVPMAVISKVLGHTDIRVTERVYAHLNTESLQKAAAVFEESISKKE